MKLRIILSCFVVICFLIFVSIFFSVHISREKLLNEQNYQFTKIDKKTKLKVGKDIAPGIYSVTTNFNNLNLHLFKVNEYDKNIMKYANEYCSYDCFSFKLAENESFINLELNEGDVVMFNSLVFNDYDSVNFTKQTGYISFYEDKFQTGIYKVGEDIKEGTYNISGTTALEDLEEQYLEEEEEVDPYEHDLAELNIKIYHEDNYYPKVVKSDYKKYFLANNEYIVFEKEPTKFVKTKGDYYDIYPSVDDSKKGEDFTPVKDEEYIVGEDIKEGIYELDSNSSIRVEYTPRNSEDGYVYTNVLSPYEKMEIRLKEGDKISLDDDTKLRAINSMDLYSDIYISDSESQSTIEYVIKYSENGYYNDYVLTDANKDTVEKGDIIVTEEF